MNIKKSVYFAVVLATGFSAQAFAQSYSAADLGKSLTDFGAIQGASSDGYVPAYTGGINKMPNLPNGGASTSWPNPFASEKPLFTVTSSNMSQYQALLTPGEQAMLSRYGAKGFVMNVYPTHRSMSYPDWVLKNTLKNAQSAQLIGDGEGVSGAYGGIPFPVPSNGYEAMWNFLLSYEPAFCSEEHEGYDVGASGGVTELGVTINKWAESYYDPTATALKTQFFRDYFAGQYTPPAVAGDAYLFEYPINYE